MIAKFIDRPREDSLTAAIFSHLLHLPSEMFWQIIKDACTSSQLPERAGEPRAIHGWPNWSAIGTRNSSRVIPDLVIEFDDFDLIIEAKRWDSPMQDKEQWKAELKAYTNVYGSKKRAVKMLALGGIHTYQDDLIKDVWCSNSANAPEEHEFTCPVFMCQWSSIQLECQRLKKKLLQKNAEALSRTLADVRILDDLTSLFIRHGFVPLRWFDDFQFHSNLLSDNAEAAHSFFRKSSLQLQAL